jgi:hypothetical protein
MNFVMSGKSDLLDAISALAAAGYECVQLPWGGGCPETLLSVLGEASPETAAAVTVIVLRADPDAVKV